MPRLWWRDTANHENRPEPRVVSKSIFVLKADKDRKTHAQRLEITLKPEIRDPEGETLKKKARDYLGLNLEEVRTIQVLTFDTGLTEEQLEASGGKSLPIR